MDRSAKPSEIIGVPIDIPGNNVSSPKSARFLHYETEGQKALIVSRFNGTETTITIEPDGAKSFRISMQDSAK